MPTVKELTILVEDRPGQMGKLARALADRGVNILAFQAFGTLTRLVADNPTAAKMARQFRRYRGVHPSRLVR